MGTDDGLCLFDPLVATNTSLVVLNGVVHFVLRLAVKVGQLRIGEDAQGVEFLFAVGPDALDGLEVICILFGRLADKFEVKGLLSLLDAVHGLLLLRLRLVLVRHDGNFPLEVNAGLAQLDATGVGAALVGGEFSVVELEVDDDFTVFSNSKHSAPFHAEGRFVHREATVVVLVVEVHHVDLDVAHVRDGDFLNGRFNGSGLEGADGSENERVVLCSCSCNEVGFCEGVLRLRAVGQHHEELVTTKQQENGEQQQEEQQAREAPHPVETVIVRTIAS